MANYFIRDRNGERGPFTPKQLGTMWDMGGITADATCRPENSDGWMPIGEGGLPTFPTPIAKVSKPSIHYVAGGGNGRKASNYGALSLLTVLLIVGAFLVFHFFDSPFDNEGKPPNERPRTDGDAATPPAVASNEAPTPTVEFHELRGSDGQIDPEKVAAKFFGPDNKLAQRIQNLNRENAMAAGMGDGSRDVMNVYLAVQRDPENRWTPYNYREKLAECIDGEMNVFSLLQSQNRFDPQVFDLYTRGWNIGANAFYITVDR